MEESNTVRAAKWAGRWLGRASRPLLWRDFAPSPLGYLLVAAAALWLGLAVYGDQQARTQRALLNAYVRASVLCEILEGHPRFDQGDCAALYGMGRTFRMPVETLLGADEVYAILVDAGVIDPEEVTSPGGLKNTADHPGPAFIWSALREDKHSLDLTRATGLDWVAHLASHLGNPSVPSAGYTTKVRWQLLLAMGLSGVGVAEPVPKTWAIGHGLSPTSLFEEYAHFTETSGERLTNAQSRLLEKLGPDDDPDPRLERRRERRRDGWAADDELFARRVFAFERALTDRELLTNLFVKADILRSGTENARGIDVQELLKRLPEGTTEESALLIYDAVETLSLYLLGQYHSNPHVTLARRAAVIVRGPEQLAIVVLAFFICMLLLLRTARSVVEAGAGWWWWHFPTKSWPPRWRIIGWFFGRTERAPFVVEEFDRVERAGGSSALAERVRLVEDRLYRTRWLIRWGLVTIPAIGFIGTVRGILQSLSGADRIVWATSQAEKANAIGALAGELGLAFATTLGALIVGIGLSLLNDFQSRGESKLLHVLQEHGVDGDWRRVP